MPQFLVEPGDLRLERSEAVLRGAEAHHLLRVFRARIGDAVEIFDGAGRRWRGKLERAASSEALLTGVAEIAANEPRVEAWLLQGVLKSEKWAWVVAKGTELGASRFVPVLAERSVATADGERANAKAERWRGVAAAAAKQCERGRIPAVDPPRSLPEVLKALGPRSPREARLLLAERRDSSLPPLEAGIEKVQLAVGPEGGWSEAEYEAWVEAGFHPVSLGPRILRAETAATAALTLVLGALGELGNLIGERP